MRAFYVPELNLNALRATESGEDPSIVVKQLMEAASEAQLVRKIDPIRNFIFNVSFHQFSQSLWEWCLEWQRTR